MNKRISLLFVFCLLLSLSPDAQELQESVEVDLVDLYLTATDSRGRFIHDLKAEDLVVKENGVIQSIHRFGLFSGNQDDLPLLLAMIMDNSASMDDTIEDTRKIDLARDAALLMTDQLGPLDRMMLVRFSDTPLYGPITPDRNAIGASLREMRTIWWQTALYDAIASTIQQLNDHRGRKVLLICSDGRDNMSQTPFWDLLKLISETPDLAIITLGIGARDAKKTAGGKDVPDVPMLRGKEYLQKLADQTAGFAYFPDSLKEMNEARERMAGFVRSQYFLAYKSTNRNQDGSFRDIKITCKRKGITLHHRTGYFAR